MAGRERESGITPEPDARDGGSERLLAFSDGVFAIAITLLVLNLVPPTVHHNLLNALGQYWEKYLSYAFSFIVIGILWVNHHHMFTYIRRSNHAMMMINVVFLMWVSFLPFPTAVLAEYLGNAGERRTAVAFYVGIFVVGALLFNAVWRYGTHNQRLTGTNPDLEAIRKTNQSYLLGPVVYLIAFAVAFVSPIASLVIFGVLALGFALSPFPGAKPG